MVFFVGAGPLTLFFLLCWQSIPPPDRFGNTPVKDALKNEHHSLVELLTTHNKKKSFATFSAAISSPLPISSPSTRDQRGGNGGGSNDGKGAKDVDPHNKPHHQIWQALASVDNNPEFTTDLLHTILEASGILKDDLRIASFMVRLCFFDASTAVATAMR